MNDAPVVLPIELTPAQVRPVAYRIISKKHGLNLKSAALDVLSRFLGRQFGADWRGPQAERTLDELSRTWKKEERGIFVDGPELSQVIKDWMNAELATTQTSQGEEQKKFDWRQYFKVVTAGDHRPVVYDATKKNFSIRSTSEPQTFGPASSLTNIFASRYSILLDKLYRSESFRPPGLDVSISSGNTHTLTPIKNLLGRSHEEEFYLFGLLEKQPDGPWTLYDNSSSVDLEFGSFSHFFPDHYYTSGSFVICHGQYTGSTFLVVNMGPPPVERRTESQEAFGNPDFYGLHGVKNSKRLERLDPDLEGILLREEEKMPNSRIVMLGADIHLDQPTVIESLRRLLTKLDTDPPIALVMAGSFISTPFQPHLNTQDGRSAAQVYRDGMNSLADILQQCPQLAANTKLIFIPGPNDPWHSMSLNVLPYRRLPGVFTGRIDHVARDIVWASNPSRLCYLSQEILLYRANCGSLLRSHSLDIKIYEQEQADNSQAEATASQATVTDKMDVDARTDDDSSLVDDEERAADRAAVRAMMESSPGPLNLAGTAGSSELKESRAVLATLLDQSHLSPLPLAISPVMWESDHVLSMAQWPTSLTVFDPTTPRTKQDYEECQIVNPGAFWQNGRVNWIELWPSSGHSKFMEMV